MRALELGVAELRMEAHEHRATTAAIFEVLKDLRTITGELKTTTDELKVTTEELKTTTDELKVTTEELRRGQEELRATTEELRKGQDELRQEMRAGYAELREEIVTVKRSVGNLELSMKRVEGDVAELKAGHMELRNLFADTLR
jgi:chromosome segregation ATPase